MNLIDQVKRDYPGADTRERNQVFAVMLFHAAEPEGFYFDQTEQERTAWINQAERALA